MWVTSERIAPIVYRDTVHACNNNQPNFEASRKIKSASAGALCGAKVGVPRATGNDISVLDRPMRSRAFHSSLANVGGRCGLHSSSGALGNRAFGVDGSTVYGLDPPTLSVRRRRRDCHASSHVTPIHASGRSSSSQR